jgi:hypothetical protein
MAVGTAFTLFFVPAIYVLIAHDQSHARKSEAPANAEGQPVAAV